MAGGVLDSSLSLAVAEMQGASVERPYTVNVPAMDGRKTLTSPGGWFSANLAMMANRLIHSHHLFPQKGTFKKKKLTWQVALDRVPQWA